MKVVCATRLVATALIAVLSTPACAGVFYSGNDIVAHCLSNKAMVSGFVAGAFDKSERDIYAYLRYAIDMVDIEKPVDNAKNESFFANRFLIRGYCAPKGITLGQVRDIFCQFLIAILRSVSCLQVIFSIKP